MNFFRWLKNKDVKDLKKIVIFLEGENNRICNALKIIDNKLNVQAINLKFIENEVHNALRRIVDLEKEVKINGSLKVKLKNNDSQIKNVASNTTKMDKGNGASTKAISDSISI